MPEGPAARGVEANASAGPCGALVVRRAFDGAEHSGNIEPVMAGPHTARHGFRRDRPSNHWRTAGRLSVHVDTGAPPQRLAMWRSLEAPCRSTPTTPRISRRRCSVTSGIDRHEAGPVPAQQVTCATRLWLETSRFAPGLRMRISRQDCDSGVQWNSDHRPIR
jgi:hypothetical protein